MLRLDLAAIELASRGWHKNVFKLEYLGLAVATLNNMNSLFWVNVLDVKASPRQFMPQLSFLEINSFTYFSKFKKIMRDNHNV